MAEQQDRRVVRCNGTKVPRERFTLDMRMFSTSTETQVHRLQNVN